MFDEIFIGPVSCQNYSAQANRSRFIVTAMVKSKQEFAIHRRKIEPEDRFIDQRQDRAIRVFQKVIRDPVNRSSQFFSLRQQVMHGFCSSRNNSSIFQMNLLHTLMLLCNGPLIKRISKVADAFPASLAGYTVMHDRGSRNDTPHREQLLGQG